MLSLVLMSLKMMEMNKEKHLTTLPLDDEYWPSSHYCWLRRSDSLTMVMKKLSYQMLELWEMGMNDDVVVESFAVVVATSVDVECVVLSFSTTDRVTFVARNQKN